MTILDIIASPALAEGAAAPQENVLLNLLPLILLFGVFYFLLIRPQQKKAKEHKKLVAELKVGDEVITQGGILGKVTATDEAFLSIEISSSVTILLQRNSIAALMPKGTYKNNSKTEDESQAKPKRRTTSRAKKEITDEQSSDSSET